MPAGSAFALPRQAPDRGKPRETSAAAGHPTQLPGPGTRVNVHVPQCGFAPCERNLIEDSEDGEDRARAM
jgi:hypothetical protein